MTTHLVLDSILPNLSGSKIDKLQKRNKCLYDYIGSIRLDLPLTDVEEIDISTDESSGEIILESYHDGFSATRTVSESQVMAYLRCIKPKVLYLNSDDVSRFLDAKWVRMIQNIEIKNTTNKTNFLNFVDEMNCSSLDCLEASFELNLDVILDRMAHVIKLKLGNVQFSTKSLQSLTDKSKLGTGIEYLCLQNSKENPFDADQLVHFIKNASFRRLSESHGDNSKNIAYVDINHVSGTAAEFEEKLLSRPNDGQWISTGIGSLQNFKFKCENQISEINIEIVQFSH